MNTAKQLTKDELFGLMNGRISILINRYLQNKFKEAGLGITVEQWTVLACLWQKDKVTQQTLSDTTLKDKTGMTRLIDNLEKKALVVRVPDPNDRRAKLIYLTRKGLDMEKQASEIVDNAVETVLATIAEDEIVACRNVLKKAINNLQ